MKTAKYLIILLVAFFINSSTEAQEIEWAQTRIGTWQTPFETNSLQYIGNEILIKFAPGLTLEEIEQILTSYDLSFQAEVAIEGWIVAQTSVDPLEKIAEIKDNQPADILNLEPNGLIELFTLIPNDSLFDQQWSLFNTGQDSGLVGADIQATEAWEISQGDSSILLIMLDTGLNFNHPEFQDSTRFLKGHDFTTESDSAVNDVIGHGSHTTGIAAAPGNNNIGIAGVDWQSKVKIHQIFRSIVSQWSWVANAISAAAIEADVINISGGGYSYSYLIEEAILELLENDVVFVCAAGNGGGGVGYPARFSAIGALPGHRHGYPNVIAVAAVDRFDQRPWWSNYGPEINVAAPGVDIISTYREREVYYVRGGTSMAAPHVAGIATVLRGLNPELSAGEIRLRIEETADQVGQYQYDQEGFNIYLGYGRVNFYRALQNLVSAVDEKSSIQPQNFTLSQNYPNPFNTTTVINYQLSVASPVRLEIFNLLGEQVTVLVEHQKQLPGFYQVDWPAGNLPTGLYFYRLRVGNKAVTKRMLLLK